MITKYSLLMIVALSLLGMQSMYRASATSYFRMKSDRKIPSKEVAKTGAMLETACAKFKKKFDVSLNNKIEVFVLDSPDRLHSESKSKTFDDAVWKNGKIFVNVTGASGNEEKFKNAIARVVSRSILAEIKACPQWLAEAYSIYAGGDITRFGQPSRVNVLSFADLAEDFSRAERQDEIREMYAKLGSTISFLVQRYGEPKVESVLMQFKAGKSFQEIFETTFGEKIGVIEKAWAKALAQPIKE